MRRGWWAALVLTLLLTAAVGFDHGLVAPRQEAERCRLPGGDFWHAARVDRRQLVESPPGANGARISAMAWDPTVAVLALCGGLASPAGLEALVLRTDTGQPVRVRRVLVAGGGATGLAVLLTPWPQDARTVTVWSSGRPLTEYAVAAPAPAACGLRSDTAAVRVDGCGAWTRLVWDGPAAAGPPDPRRLDVRLTLRGREQPVLAWVEDVDGRRTLVLSAPVRPGAAYRLTVWDPAAPTRRTVRFSLSGPRGRIGP